MCIKLRSVTSQQAVFFIRTHVMAQNLSANSSRMVASQTSYSTAQMVRAKGWETRDNWPNMPQGQFVTTAANHGTNKKVHHINMALGLIQRTLQYG
jgi:hypothetical protein